MNKESLKKAIELDTQIKKLEHHIYVIRRLFKGWEIKED